MLMKTMLDKYFTVIYLDDEQVKSKTREQPEEH